MESSYTPLLSISWNGAMILRGREKDGIVYFGMYQIINARTQKGFPLLRKGNGKGISPCTVVQRVGSGCVIDKNSRL